MFLINDDAPPHYPVDVGALAVRLWHVLNTQAIAALERHPNLGCLVIGPVLECAGLGSAMAARIAGLLGPSEPHERRLMHDVLHELSGREDIVCAIAADLEAVVQRDPAFQSELEVFLFAKGFVALQAYRFGHVLLQQGRRLEALYLQARCNVVLGIDINPACRIGLGVLLDHGTGIVIGETAVVEDHVSILQGVTLGGTGKDSGDRHPKVRTGVMIGAGAKILGNIEIGAGSKVGANSVVLKAVPPRTTVVGIPACAVGQPRHERPAQEMDQSIN
ncbi:serine O-acetyltransferase [Pseudomonas sp. K2I15]|uniref:serine O-acetyltransferase n=1 Tax=unclassified Pseudomonas TaxID=196821 RepID=UPI000B4D6859|nr:serine O-acetyltransferase [Pseudomonas sp. K2I15]OWP69472.1 serine O-acetyltransferase [Pseudomonas sp. K2I15]